MNNEKLLAFKMMLLRKKIEAIPEDEDVPQELLSQRRVLLNQYYQTFGDNVVPLVQE